MRPSLCAAVIGAVAASMFAVPTPAPLPGLLRPTTTETRSQVDLSGIWDFLPEGYPGQGVKEGWNTRLPDGAFPMPVPASYNDVTTNQTIRDWVGVVWYQTDFIIPGAFKSERTLLYFGSVHYYADVFLNGQLVVSHEGGHLPFEADITTMATFGQYNRLTVAVNNTLFISSIPPGSVVVNSVGRPKINGNFDFFNYAGIHREVLLHFTPAATHVDDITTVTSIAGNAASVQIATSATGAASISASLLDATGAVAASNTSTVNGDGLASLLLCVKDPQLWFPWTMSTNPAYLYTLVVTANDASGNAIDVYRMQYGLRTVRIEGTQLLINGQPAYLTGFGGHHEDADVRGKALDLPMIVHDFNMMTWLGANSFRTSHYPYSSVIMDMADRYGFMVIDESPAVGVLGPNQINATLAHHLEVEAELVRRDKNRASAVIWSVANEPDSTTATAGEYFSTVMDYVRSLDSTRPVSFVSCHDYNDDKAVPFADIIFINRYYGWYIQTGELDTISHDLTADIMNWRALYPNKPMMETEYGADTVAGLHDVNDFIFTEDFQAAFTQQYFNVFDAMRNSSTPFWIGEHVWSFSDFMTDQSINRVVGNKKGILTRSRQPKAVANLFRKRYLSLAASSPTCPSSLEELASNGCSSAYPDILMRAAAEVQRRGAQARNGNSALRSQQPTHRLDQHEAEVAAAKEKLRARVQSLKESGAIAAHEAELFARLSSEL